MHYKSLDNFTAWELELDWLNKGNKGIKNINALNRIIISKMTEWRTCRSVGVQGKLYMTESAKVGLGDNLALEWEIPRHSTLCMKSWKVNATDAPAHFVTIKINQHMYIRTMKKNYEIIMFGAFGSIPSYNFLYGHTEWIKISSLMSDFWFTPFKWQPLQPTT